MKNGPSEDQEPSYMVQRTSIAAPELSKWFLVKLRVSRGRGEWATGQDREGELIQIENQGKKGDRGDRVSKLPAGRVTRNVNPNVNTDHQHKFLKGVRKGTQIRNETGVLLKVCNGKP